MCRIWSEEPPHRIEGKFYRTTAEGSIGGRRHPRFVFPVHQLQRIPPRHRRLIIGRLEPVARGIGTGARHLELERAT
jgi:hypothetical protein